MFIYFSWFLSNALIDDCVWTWRFSKFSDYYHVKKQIESEFVDGTEVQLSKSFLDLPKADQQTRLKDRLKKYCQKVYSSLQLNHFAWVRFKADNFICRLTNECWKNQSLNFGKQESAWGKTHFMLTLLEGEYTYQPRFCCIQWIWSLLVE